MCEILAPIGSKNNLITAVSSGANAVYLGLKDFSARKTAENFSLEELKHACAYCKAFNVKVYLTVNTLVKDSELSEFLNVINQAYACGVDAFILQDLFLGKFIKENMPEITLHLSTQAGVCNEYGAIQAKKHGFSRVILARETKIEDIKKICNIIETEVFIHGALCTSFSGHCYFSSFIGGNSGNRGLCKQPCRKKYSYVVNGKTLKTGYVLSLADLCSVNDLLKLKELGVKSFKIEGRLRSEEYLASAIALYKNKLNGKTISLDNVKTAYNRGDYTRLLGFGQEKSFISSNIQGHKGLYYGKIVKVLQNELIIDKTGFNEGDSFKIIRNGLEVGSAIAVKSKTNAKLSLQYRGAVQNGDSLHITKSTTLLSSLNLEKPLVDIEVTVNATLNNKLSLSCDGITVCSTEVLPEAKSAPATKEDVISSLVKTDIYPFKVAVKFENFDSNLFILKSMLNKLRAELYGKLFYRNSTKIPYNIAKYENILNRNQVAENRQAVITQTLNQNFENISDVIYAPLDYNHIEPSNIDNKRIWLYLPPFASTNDITVIDKVIDKFYGVYGDGYWALEYAKQNRLNFFAGCGFNLFNSLSVNKLIEEGVTSYVVSKELSLAEIDKIGGNPFVLNGAVEIMDLIYCPFSKNCKNCSIPNNFKLVDEENRQFDVIRYKISECRFKVFNNACLNLKHNHSNIVDARITTNQLTKGNYVKGIK